jgi:hypothetical protein
MPNFVEIGSTTWKCAGGRRARLCAGDPMENKSRSPSDLRRLDPRSRSRSTCAIVARRQTMIHRRFLVSAAARTKFRPLQRIAHWATSERMIQGSSVRITVQHESDIILSCWLHCLQRVPFGHGIPVKVILKMEAICSPKRRF